MPVIFENETMNEDEFLALSKTILGDLNIFADVPATVDTDSIAAYGWFIHISCILELKESRATLACLYRTSGRF